MSCVENTIDQDLLQEDKGRFLLGKTFEEKRDASNPYLQVNNLKKGSESHLKIIGNLEQSCLGQSKYTGYKEFMNDYFKHRELIAMRDMNKAERVKYSRKLYKRR